MRGLQADILPAQQVLAQHAEQLYRLYASCYDSTDPARFRADLEEKQWVILLLDEATGAVVGFSTQLLIDAKINQRPVHALFSGDTIICEVTVSSLERAEQLTNIVTTFVCRNQHGKEVMTGIARGVVRSV